MYNLFDLSRHINGQEKVEGMKIWRWNIREGKDELMLLSTRKGSLCL